MIVPVELTNEHLSKLRRTQPHSAVAELIWNALDADSTRVTVLLDPNPLEGLSKIRIVDNGHGIAYDGVSMMFGRLGSTHKLVAERSPLGRLYHGKYGEGRYKAFALGSQVEWLSVFRLGDGLYEFSIRGSTSNLREFTVSDVRRSNAPGTGVTVTIENVEQSALHLDAALLADRLTTLMAPYLLAYKGIDVSVDGYGVDPSSAAAAIADHQLSVETRNRGTINANLKIIEWRSGSHKNLYLCTAEGIALEEEPSGIPAGSISHTAYVMSTFVSDLLADGLLSVRSCDEAYGQLMEQVDRALRDHLRQRQTEKAVEAIEVLKAEEVYPYQGEPSSDIEKAERRVFDICAVRLHQHLPAFRKAERKNKKLTLALMREALQTNFSSLRRILQEVLDLPRELQDEFADILTKTSLAAVIGTSRMIMDRLEFLNALDQMIYGKEFHKSLKERSQLHKILLSELWVFGEEFHYGVDDSSLRNVLKAHLNILGRKELAQEVDVSQLKDLRDIPDVCLWRQYPTGAGDRFDHLVIELKRPSRTVNSEDISQAKKYARAISENPRFDKVRTHWTVILVGHDLTSDAEFECVHSDRPWGLVVKQNGLDVWVKKWSQIIHDNKGRLDYLKKSLDYNITDDAVGLDYLAKKYYHLVPKIDNL
ncbi:MAG: ATP-binding protein [Ignavibacteriales bacterium]